MSTGSSTTSTEARNGDRGKPRQMYGSGSRNDVPSMNVTSSLGSSGSFTGVGAVSAFEMFTTP